MECRYVPLHYPEGVKKVIGFGSSSFIGRVNDSMVLKYPRVAGEQWERFLIEARIYEALGRHPRILTCFGLDGRGLMLEFARNGTVRDYIRSQAGRSLSPMDKLKWCRQAAEAVAYIHKRNVIHCDINTRNFLLDDKLDLKLSDFQGLYTDPEGVTINGFALENAKSFLPRVGDHSDRRSDLFALGTAMYGIMTGHEPFPELDEIDDEEEIERRYTQEFFPDVTDVLGGSIIHKCWALQFDNVDTCATDLTTLEEDSKESSEQTRERGEEKQASSRPAGTSSGSAGHSIVASEPCRQQPRLETRYPI